MGLVSRFNDVTISVSTANVVLGTTGSDESLEVIRPRSVYDTRTMTVHGAFPNYKRRLYAPDIVHHETLAS